MSECTHNCETCSQKCADRKPASLLEKPHDMSSIKKVIGIVSGKGGVGKSSVTSILSVLMNRMDYNVGILDADITGPSIPKAFGIKERAKGIEGGIFPVKSKTGIDVMSINLLLETEETPVVWRGPVIAGTVKQFWQDVIWEDIDYMFIDLPPGTGDVPLTVFQSIPVDGIIIVTSPQDLVSMIVSKAVNMANMMNVPILGLVENYSYVKCPDCNKTINIFGDSHIEEVAENFGLEVLAKMPMDRDIAQACDKGVIELFENDYLDGVCEKIIEKTK